MDFNVAESLQHLQNMREKVIAAKNGERVEGLSEPEKHSAEAEKKSVRQIKPQRESEV